VRRSFAALAVRLDHTIMFRLAYQARG